MSFHGLLFLVDGVFPLLCSKSLFSRFEVWPVYEEPVDSLFSM